MKFEIQEVDKVEILTLQDNYFDALSGDNNQVVSRAIPLKGMEIKNTLLAEHGFASLVTVTTGDRSRSLIFDFGFSDFGAAFNAEALSLNLSSVELLVVSHGHLDHVGGLKNLVDMVGKKGLDLILHPVAFRRSRYMKLSEELKFNFPPFTREQVAEAGANVVEHTEPYPLLDGAVLFLGEIPRKTEFEKGAPNVFYLDEGKEKCDPIEDDTAIVVKVKGKGLVVLSGCAHSGMVNTVNYARELTGVDKIYAVMGGFHLTGPAMAPVIEPTIKALKEINPDYIVPTHCTGRNATLKIEKEMPDQFIVNMAGTKLTFAA